MYDVDVDKTPQLEVDVAEQGLGLSTIGLGDASLGSAVIPLQDVLRSCQVRGGLQGRAANVGLEKQGRGEERRRLWQKPLEGATHQLQGVWMQALRLAALAQGCQEQCMPAVLTNLCSSALGCCLAWVAVGALATWRTCLTCISLYEQDLGLSLLLLLLLLQMSRWTKQQQHGYWRKVIPLTGGFSGAALELELEFLPDW
jgi:hypothetical protein